MPRERFEHCGHAMRGDEIARPVILRERRLCEMRTISQITPIDAELFKKAPTFINCHFRQQQRELVSFDKTCDRLVALESNKPEVMRLVGTEGGYGEEVGLARDWAARIIRHVGNYSEVYDRNVGVDSKLGIPRGLNQLWNEGGILYAPPIQ
jgi:hypothetical protein